MGDKEKRYKRPGTIENNFSLEYGDMYGFGKGFNAIPNTIKETGNFDLPGEIGVDTFKSDLEAPFEFNKYYKENVDRNKQRRFRDIYADGLKYNEDDNEHFYEQKEKIKNKYRNNGLQNIYEHDFQKFNEKNELLKAGNPVFQEIKSELVNSVDYITNVEMKQNAFQNMGKQFQKINQIEGRIGALEVTVQKNGEIFENSENRIGKIENTLDLHSMQLANNDGRIGKIEGKVSQNSRQIRELGNIVNINSQQIENLNNRVNDNTRNIKILNDRTNIIQENVNHLNNVEKDLGNEIVKTNKRMDEGFNILKNNNNQSHQVLHGEIVQTNKIMEKGFNILDNNIKNNYNILHREVLQTKDNMKKGFNFFQDEIIDTNKNMNAGFNNIKDDIKDVRKKIQSNNYYWGNQISNLNNMYFEQFGKIDDELKNQKVKLVENENKLKKYEKTLVLFSISNAKQKERIKEHEIILNKHQENLMNCIKNVKGLYQQANELRYNLMEENKKINEIAKKNDFEINEIKIQCQKGLEKVNEISQILNKHTQILTEQSSTIAKIQAISFKNTEKINELCSLLFNHESRIKNLEGRVDKIEEILIKHEEAILNLTGDVSDMKKQMNEVLERIKKLEERIEKFERNSIQEKANKIYEFLDMLNDNGLYEFANFILDLRNMDKPFGLQNVLDGIKIIADHNRR